ncbi:restriction endonuclease [Chryseobacterium elymi]|uniref:Restriction endonuclease n=1 Tax=Chryseobacterium elymi TaxID=395936 RepID=A0A3D9DJF2_9FLAO|nr:restriction endonuclease [Chryseobacterium elymi]REC78137.1 restriction endonuclease [Chryseobacterium elymi]
MAVPDFQTIMYPFLEVIKDGQIYSLDQMVEMLSVHFSLNSDDLRERIPSGKQPLFRNRVGWSRSYLDKAGLIITPSRGHYQITELGKQALNDATLSYINIAFLRRFEAFQQWESTFNSEGSNDLTGSTVIEEIQAETPDVIIGKATENLHKSLKYELLQLLKSKTPDFFERFVVELLAKMGYGGVDASNFEVVGQSNDGGIDGIIYQDHLRIEKIYVQAKKWDSTKVSPKDIRDFIGALNLKGTTKGVFITTSTFTNEALNAANQNPHNKIVLIDSDRLLELAIQFNVGIQTKKIIEIKEIDNDFFED